ncbi:hypothetical protein ACFSCZ_13015 [Siminovitchia sediminis]|uniref:Uncharacterized protein n=1 Tax=Siminovitchia sediminis TaxID=1274353 RepID=A0ABW4KHW8_9BACI
MEKVFIVLAAAVQLSIFGGILYLLFKYGKPRFVKKIHYVYKHFGNKLKVSYKKFHGFNYYYFRVKKDETVSVRYNVTVEEGSLTLEWRDSKSLLFSKTFHENDDGEFTFTAKKKLHSLKLEADHSRGGCRIELIRKSA